MSKLKLHLSVVSSSAHVLPWLYEDSLVKHRVDVAVKLILLLVKRLVHKASAVMHTIPTTMLDTFVKVWTYS